MGSSSRDLDMTTLLPFFESVAKVGTSKHTEISTVVMCLEPSKDQTCIIIDKFHVPT